MTERRVGAPLRLAGRLLAMDSGFAALFLACAAATLAMTAWKAVGPLTAADVCLLGAVFALLPRLSRVRLKSFRAPLAAIALVVAGGLLGTAFSPAPAQSLAELAKFAFVAGGAVLLVALWAPTPLQIRRFAWLWVLSGALSGLVAVGVPDLHNFVRPSGLTPHANHLGLVSVLLFPVGVVLAYTSRGRLRLAGTAMTSLMAVAIVLSGSRAAAAAAVMVTLILLAALRSRAVTSIFVVAGIAGLGIAASGVVTLGDQNVLDRLFGGDESVSRSEAARDEYNREAVERLEAHPLTGQGFDEAERAHSIYLQIGSSAGLLGLAGAAVLVAFTGLVVVRGVLRRHPAASEERFLLVALAAGFGGFLAAGAFFNVLVDRNVWLALALFSWLAAKLAMDDLPRWRPQRRGVDVAES